MTDRIWSRSELERFLRWEDSEVRCWAADRLARHFPEESTAALAPYLFDDHDLTPEIVAGHLGRHGGPEHIPHLTRALSSLKGMPAARALEALVRLKAPNAVELVRGAADRRDFDEECWATIVEALSGRSDAAARSALQDVLKRRADWVGSPPILGAALRHAGPGGYRPLLQAWLRSLQWRGAGSDAEDGGAGESFRVLMDHLEVDDCGWCFRTTLAGRIDLERTLKAIESSYDCELRATLGAEWTARLGEALEAGAFETSAARLAEAARHLARAAAPGAGDDLRGRIEEVVSFWGDPEVAQAIEALGPHPREWVIGFLLSAVVKMARYRNFKLEVRRASGDLGSLLPLLEVETSAMIDDLPEALRDAVDAAGPAASPARSAARRAVEERCLALLSMRGPFFPQVMALETLGELGSSGAANEVIDFLAEDNSYLYEAAEHALGSIGVALIEPARARLEAGTVEDDAAHSLLIALCELGTSEALSLVLEHFDHFVDATGAADAARWLSMFGAREAIDPLRKILADDMAQVGQSVLLLASIHNLHVPEEASIRRAIDEYWKEQPEGSDSGDAGPDDGSGKYVM
jgi:HEAT repeat protein